jgi:hypothetical protein
MLFAAERTRDHALIYLKNGLRLACFTALLPRDAYPAAVGLYESKNLEYVGDIGVAVIRYFICLVKYVFIP